MALFLKILKWFGIVFLALLIIALIVLNVFMNQYNKDKKIEKVYQKKGVSIKVNHEDIDGWKTRSIFTTLPEINTDSKELMVFVHGAPGSSMDFKSFMGDKDILAKYDVLSVDRLGYGKAKNTEQYYNIKEQSKAIVNQLKGYDYDSITLVGHSYGGPVVAYVGTLLEGKKVKAIMLAPVIDPENEKIFWYSPLANMRPFRWFMPKAFVVAGYEKMNHAKMLADVESAWTEIDFPIVHMHGKKDGLAPPINIDYVKESFPSSYLEQVILDDAGHLLPFLNYEEVKNILLNSSFNLESKEDLQEP